MLVVLPNAFGHAATNMAIDTTLLATVPEGTAVFRHYGWLEPSLTFGYSQHISEVTKVVSEQMTLCRRPSGGGIVDHRNDWTYALVIHRGTAAAGETPTTLYGRIHQSMIAALKTLNQPSTLAPCPCQGDTSKERSDGPEQCFVHPAINDVLSPEGRKVAGAAMKRAKRALLVQGSVDRESFPENFNFGAFKQAFVNELSQTLELPLQQTQDFRPYFDSGIIDEATRKFADPAWTRRR